ncbi:MAG TPA: ATP-binding cassette domain-containing protein, partial [Myxococcales bacterium]|nr:ATP-binding cassette domain-containing protein [Myxococcales bacterium]
MIVAEDLQVVLQGRTVLDGVGFAVRRGEAVALVGANGSGKTTVLRCLLGLVPFSGRARIG